MFAHYWFGLSLIAAWLLLPSCTLIVGIILQEFRQQVVQSPLSMQKLEQSDCGTNKTADQGGVHAGPAEHVIPCIPYPVISKAIADHRCRVPQVVSPHDEPCCRYTSQACRLQHALQFLTSRLCRVSTFLAAQTAMYLWSCNKSCKSRDAVLMPCCCMLNQLEHMCLQSQANSVRWQGQLSCLSKQPVQLYRPQ